MRKNNVIKITAIALLSAFALTACDDDIIAKPTGYDDNSPVVNLPSGTEVYNNTFTDIYDSIRSGSLASDVLDELLYQYSVSGLLHPWDSLGKNTGVGYHFLLQGIFPNSLVYY